MEKIKLFCIPYAGGNASAYCKWKIYLNPALELQPLELAGRGKRIQDRMYNSLDEAVDDIYKMIEHDIQRSPYALFGHSLGAKLCYLLVRKIIKMKLPRPLHLFFSGNGAPHVAEKDDRKYHLMDNDTFRKEVLELGGTPPELFDYPELMELFIPLLKNDFKIIETYPLDKTVEPLDQDISVFLGTEDDLTSAQCEEWRCHTRGKCNIIYFDGGHFFLHNHTQKIVEKINQTVLECYR